MSVLPIGLKALHRWYPWMLSLSDEIGATPSTIEIGEYTREVIKKHRIQYHLQVHAIDAKVYFFTKNGTCLGMTLFLGSLPRCVFELLYLSARSNRVVNTKDIAHVVLLSRHISLGATNRDVYVYRFPEDTSMHEFILKDVQYLRDAMNEKMDALQAHA